jgi:hypothetical protein
MYVARIAGRREAKFLKQGNMREREHLDDLGIDSIMLKCIFKRCDGEAWTRFVWFRIGIADCRLLMW